MTDSFAAEIWIGGQVSRTARLYPDDLQDTTTVLQGLIAVLNSDGASHEFGEAEIPADCTEADLLKYINEKGLLNLRDVQARGGEFPETEQFCLDNGIAYDRWSDHYAEYDSEKASWRPGMDSPMTVYSDSNGNEVVGGKLVREALELLQDSVKAKAAEARAAAIRLLGKCCPPAPPKLKKFKIVD